MPEYGFVVTVPNGDEQEYRTSGNALGPEEAVERCYSKHPEGRITRVLYGDVNGVDLTNPDSDDGGDSDDELTGVTESPLDPSEYSVSDLEFYIENEPLSADELNALLEAERDGKDRTTAASAIEAAIEDTNE